MKQFLVNVATKELVKKGMSAYAAQSLADTVYDNNQRAIEMAKDKYKEFTGFISKAKK